MHYKVELRQDEDAAGHHGDTFTLQTLKLHVA